MKILVIIFLIISFTLAISTIGYVTADVVVEKRKKKKADNADCKRNGVHIEQELIIESCPVIVPENLPEPTSVETGIEIIEVAWPESIAKNKIYRYDPNGETLRRGDTVLVPTFDALRHREVLRTATVINGNYRADPCQITKTLKKIIKRIN